MAKIEGMGAPVDIEALEQDARAILARLVGFDTTSFKSNLALIDYIAGLLADLGIEAVRVESPDGGKANLYATIGPLVPGGVILSGHTDVVPVEGQPWSSDPFIMVERDGRFYGRGTSDMKAFIACAMAAAPLFAQPGRLARPIHFAWSYDEEVGCTGAPAMIDELARRLPAPAAVIVGEPTSMKVVGGHKGVAIYKVVIRGHAAHSSLTHLGVSANMIAARLMAKLIEIEQQLIEQAQTDSPFEPAHSTLTIGLMNGGTAINILAQDSSFAFDLRCTPDVDPDVVLAPFFEEARTLDEMARQRFPDCRVVVEHVARVPAFAPEPEGSAEAFARTLSGDNGPLRVVPYGSEAGQFQQAGMSVVIVGPGSIEQAHQPDEFIDIDQIDACVRFMVRLAEALA